MIVQVCALATDAEKKEIENFSGNVKEETDHTQQIMVQIISS